MYAASTYFNSAIAAGSRQLDIKATIGANTYLNDSIVSLYFEDTVCPDEFFEVGTVSAAYIEITLLNVTGNFDGLQVTPQIGVYTSQNAFEYVPLGVFYVEETVKNRGSLTLKCFDKMILLEQPYSTSIAWPNTLTNVMNEICSKVGISFSGTLPAYTVSFPNGATTYREVLSRISGLCGGFAKFDRTGNLTIKNYAVTPSIQQTITADNYFDLNKEDRTYTIGKTTIKDDASNVSFSNGATSSTNMELIIDNNPWATAPIATDIYNKLNGLSFLPCTMSWQGNPALDLGDWVTINEYNATPFNTILTSMKFNFAGGLSSDVEATGEGKTKNQYSTNPSVIPNPSDTVQTNVDYNGVTITQGTGIQVENSKNTVTLNATDGFKIIRNSDGAVMIDLDSVTGNALFNGILNSDTVIISPPFGTKGMISIQLGSLGGLYHQIDIPQNGYLDIYCQNPINNMARQAFTNANLQATVFNVTGKITQGTLPVPTGTLDHGTATVTGMSIQGNVYSTRVNFNKTFPSTPTVTVTCATGTPNTAFASVTAIDTTGFTINAVRTASTADLPVFWNAIGN
jgi:hypothetical protein